MATAAILEIKVRAIKCTIATRFLMQIGIQTKKGMPSSKIRKPEALAKFQDDRRRHFVNWKECYKMGNYHPILMKFDTQTKKNMLSLRVTKAEVTHRIQDGHCRHVGTSMLRNG
jgi:hypothetical protein